jgi:hypothetical protein
VTKVLCRALADPPMDVPAPKPASAGGTTRQRFTEHDTNQCAVACHGLIDPIGFAFENYDGIGKYRTTDNGLDVDASGSYAIDGATKAFAGGVELARLLGSSDEARGCFASQWARFALLREPTDADRASLQAAARAFSSVGGVRDLVLALAASRSFMYRAPAPGEVLP